MPTRHILTRLSATAAAARTPALAATLTILVLAALSGTAIADIIVVNCAGPGDYETIQEALDVAENGDVISVEPGTYTGSNNRDLDFGTKKLTLVSTGGASETIIDCEAEDNHRCIDFNGGGQDTTCVVDGFTFANGRMVISGSAGAGIRCYGASPLFLNCIFSNNTCSGQVGGAVFCDDAASPVFRDCTFDENGAQKGGAVYCDNTSRPKFSNTTFTGNFGGDEGGAAYFGWQCDAEFTRCTFSENITELAGGAVTCSQATPWFLNCTFIRNTGDVRGGAAHITSGSSPVFMSCTFVSNSGSEEGGTVHVNTGSYPSMWNCIFAFTAESDGSVIYVDDSSSAGIQRCCSYGNAPGDALPATPTDDYIIADPLFCDVTIDDLTLASDSPCLPGHNHWEATIGAYLKGCEESPVRRTSWGAIKAIYR
jgi:predicted outer membrane repeat protein